MNFKPALFTGSHYFFIKERYFPFLKGNLAIKTWIVLEVRNKSDKERQIAMRSLTYMWNLKNKGKQTHREQARGCQRGRGRDGVGKRCVGQIGEGI